MSETYSTLTQRHNICVGVWRVLSYPLDIISVCIESAGTQPDPILTLHASQVGLAQRVRGAACARDSFCYVRV